MAPSAFPIQIIFGGGLTARQRGVFSSAADRWGRVITAPLPAVRVSAKIGGQLKIVETRGIIIEASGAPIDGVGRILGQAGPTRLRPNLASMGKARLLPCKGIMAFDTADLGKMESDGILRDVITHEMGHVLGIGTAWFNKGLLVGAGTTNPRFSGPKARHEFVGLGGSGSVPVENSGGPGTRDSHWRERIYGAELMTGYVSPAWMANPLSRTTIASLEDIGYSVDYDVAEPFTLFPSPGAPNIELPHCLPTVAQTI